LKKKTIALLGITLVLIVIFALNYNPVINKKILKADNTKLINNGIIPINVSVTNCFLLRIDNKYILIDTVYEHEWDIFNNALKKANVDIMDISHILLTHHHDDHIGLLNKLTTLNNDIIVVMSELAKDSILKGENDRNHDGGFVNKWVRFIKVINNKFNKNFNELKFTPYVARENDILITDDVRLTEIGIDLDGIIIKTPGHTKDSISIVLDNGYAFVGDAAANMPIFQLVGANYFVLVLEDIDTYYNSWNKIISSKEKYIFPSHGNSFLVEKLSENMWKNEKEKIVSNK